MHALDLMEKTRDNCPMTQRTFDFAVVGAGCFGAWTARALLDAGHSVILLDAYGAAHSRASSGGESRVIRMGYGLDALYTRWSMRSLAVWRELDARCQQRIFHPAGMLWMSGSEAGYVADTQRTLRDLGVAHERLSPQETAKRFPLIAVDDLSWALWEPNSGALMARRAIQTLVAESAREGMAYRIANIAAPDSSGSIRSADGETISAAKFVFACGPWLPRLFPSLLGQRIFPTRQEVFFFAPPAGDLSCGSVSMPAWLHHPDLVYGLPDLENRGFKISIDKHGPAFDPDTGSRLPSEDGLATARAYLARRFPTLRDATLTESRVCQYENTSNGDFIIDRHPQRDDILIVGGGSGHGFKHGPAIGEYVCDLLTRSDFVAEPRFAMSSKATTQSRAVY
jgi:monomeric sarcosine oxidase